MLLKTRELQLYLFNTAFFNFPFCAFVTVVVFLFCLLVCDNNVTRAAELVLSFS